MNLLTATLQEAIERAVQQGMCQIKQELVEQAANITEVEQRTSNQEDEHTYALAAISKLEQQYQTLLDKVDDLENRSGRSNICIIGLPESYSVGTLLKLCEPMIPQALGLKHSCTVERAHRLGPLKPDCASPRPVIAKFLNYQDNATILQQFRKEGRLTIEGDRLLIFVDYSQEVLRKRKAFSPICTSPYNNRVKFILVYLGAIRREGHIF